MRNVHGRLLAALYCAGLFIGLPTGQVVSQELPEGEAKATNQLANPAAVYCTESGGTYKIEDGEKGQFGTCSLPDGRVIDAWDYFRQQHSETENSQ